MRSEALILLALGVTSASADDGITCGTGTIYDSPSGTCIVDPQVLANLQEAAINAAKTREKRAPDTPSLKASCFVVQCLVHCK